MLFISDNYRLHVGQVVIRDKLITVQRGSADTVVWAMNAFNGKCRFWPTVLSVAPLLQHVVCRLSVCNVLY